MVSWPSGYHHSDQISNKNRDSLILFRLCDVYPTGLKKDIYAALVLTPIMIYLWRAAQSFELWQSRVHCHFIHPLLMKVRKP